MRNASYLQQISAAQARYFAERENRQPPTEFVYRAGHLVKRRKKLGPYDHKGVAFYDRERMRQPLAPVVHPRGFDGYSAPPSWAAIPESWDKWDGKLPAGYFHQCEVDVTQPVESLDAPPIAQTADYKLERCHVEITCSYRNPNWHRTGEPQFISRRAIYRWELTFSDGATFRFTSRAIAEAGLTELLKIRKAKHPRPRFGKHSPENDCVYFTGKKLAKLPVSDRHGH